MNRLRIAKELVKYEMRKNGIKISSVDAKQITKAAQELMIADPEIRFSDMCFALSTYFDKGGRK